MATINIKEIMEYLSKKGEKDALPGVMNKEGYFVEIRFDDPESKEKPGVDEELANKVITSDSAYGFVTIVFDKYGRLESIDLS